MPVGSFHICNRWTSAQDRHYQGLWLICFWCAWKLPGCLHLYKCTPVCTEQDSLVNKQLWQRFFGILKNETALRINGRLSLFRKDLCATQDHCVCMNMKKTDSVTKIKYKSCHLVPTQILHILRQAVRMLKSTVKRWTQFVSRMEAIRFSGETFQVCKTNPQVLLLYTIILKTDWR